MKKPIDFSCKHNVLIRNQDGSLLPMDEPYFESEMIAPGTWKLMSDGDYFYLIEGEEEALVIDSGYGCGDVRAFCQSLTKKSVRNIANTHDHFDHTANNVYFDCAYMAEETVPLATRPFPSFEGVEFPRDYKVKVIDEGDIISLGNRELEVFKIPDHAVGSLAFLDRKERLLFAGDEIGMPLGKTLNGSVERFADYMKKLQKHRKEFDWICAGFGIVEGNIIERYIDNLQYILSGHVGIPVKKEQSRNTIVENGHVIYDRRLPRPCDMPKDLNKNSEYKRMMEYADCKIIYDIRKIKEC